MRYQLRYIRASRARCRHVRTETIVHPSMATQISLRFSESLIAQRILAETAARASVRRRSPAGTWLGVRSRGSVGERPLHTRKVAGSIPAGTTSVCAGKTLYLDSLSRLDVIPVLSDSAAFLVLRSSHHR